MQGKTKGFRKERGYILLLTLEVWCVVVRCKQYKKGRSVMQLGHPNLPSPTLSYLNEFCLFTSYPNKPVFLEDICIIFTNL